MEIRPRDWTHALGPPSKAKPKRDSIDPFYLSWTKASVTASTRVLKRGLNWIWKSVTGNNWSGMKKPIEEIRTIAQTSAHEINTLHDQLHPSSTQLGLGQFSARVEQQDATQNKWVITVHMDQKTLHLPHDTSKSTDKDSSSLSTGVGAQYAFDWLDLAGHVLTLSHQLLPLNTADTLYFIDLMLGLLAFQLVDVVHVLALETHFLTEQVTMPSALKQTELESLEYYHHLYQTYRCRKVSSKYFFFGWAPVGMFAADSTAVALQLDRLVFWSKRHLQVAAALIECFDQLATHLRPKRALIDNWAFVHEMAKEDAAVLNEVFVRWIQKVRECLTSRDVSFVSHECGLIDAMSMLMYQQNVERPSWIKPDQWASTFGRDQSDQEVIDRVLQAGQSFPVLKQPVLQTALRMVDPMTMTPQHDESRLPTIGLHYFLANVMAGASSRRSVVDALLVNSPDASLESYGLHPVHMLKNLFWVSDSATRDLIMWRWPTFASTQVRDTEYSHLLPMHAVGLLYLWIFFNNTDSRSRRRRRSSSSTRYRGVSAVYHRWVTNHLTEWRNVLGRMDALIKTPAFPAGRELPDRLRVATLSIDLALGMREWVELDAFWQMQDAWVTTMRILHDPARYSEVYRKTHPVDLIYHLLSWSSSSPDWTDAYRAAGDAERLVFDAIVRPVMRDMMRVFEEMTRLALEKRRRTNDPSAQS